MKKFLKLVAAAGITDEKPAELVVSAVIRARMLELIGNEIRTEFSSDELFTIGLFSLIDAMLDKKMEDIFKKISFSEKINNALLKKNEQINDILQTITNFKKGDWKIYNVMSGKDAETYKKLNEFYMDGIKMAEIFSR